jgi:hypothetical protein
MVGGRFRKQVDMSFYKGLVAKLICHCVHDNTSEWEVVSVYYLDTSCNENIHTDFSHKSVARAFVIPVDAINNFVPGSTKTVMNVFDIDSGTESWKALT